MGWDSYYSKHCARFYGWLPATKKFTADKKTKKLKYLSLCDTNAIDIFMLEMAGVLTRDENQFLTDVIICEKDSDKIPEIIQVVRPPLKEAIIQGKIQKLLLFEDDAQTRDIDPDNDVRSRKLRLKLNLKKNAQKLKNHFPFDLINFDPWESLLRPNSEIFRAFEKIFELQQPINSFLLFATTPISHPDDIQDCFVDDFKSNIKYFDEIKTAAYEVLKTNDFDAIVGDNKKMAIGVGKTIIAKMAKQHGWCSHHHGIYVYENDSGRKLLSAVVELTKANDDNSWYSKDIVNIIKNMPHYFSYDSSLSDDKVIKHLKPVIKNREEIQKIFDQCG
jgi:hypothetical protein